MKLSNMERLGRLLNEVLQGILFLGLSMLSCLAWSIGALFIAGMVLGGC
jgi:hypothetical protein